PPSPTRRSSDLPVRFVPSAVVQTQCLAYILQGVPRGVTRLFGAFVHDRLDHVRVTGELLCFLRDRGEFGDNGVDDRLLAFEATDAGAAAALLHPVLHFLV